MKATAVRKQDLLFAIITRDTFLEIINQEYERDQSLVPFSGGDRAGKLGFESSEAFAKRKIYQSLPGSPGHRGRGPSK